jgi:hypothetical protein
MSVTNVITCLSPCGQTGAIPSRLARMARPRSRLIGLDRMSPTRRGLAIQVRQKCLAVCKHFYAASR